MDHCSFSLWVVLRVGMSTALCFSFISASLANFHHTMSHFMFPSHLVHIPSPLSFFMNGLSLEYSHILTDMGIPLSSELLKADCIKDN